MKIYTPKVFLYIFLAFFLIFLIIAPVSINLYIFHYKIENDALFYSMISLYVIILIINIILLPIVLNKYRLLLLKNFKKSIEKEELQKALSKKIENCEKFNAKINKFFHFKTN